MNPIFIFFCLKTIIFVFFIKLECAVIKSIKENLINSIEKIHYIMDKVVNINRMSRIYLLFKSQYNTI